MRFLKAAACLLALMLSAVPAFAEFDDSGLPVTVIGADETMPEDFYAGAAPFFEAIPDTVEAEKVGDDIYRIKGTDRLIRGASRSVPDKMKETIDSYNAVLDRLDGDIEVYAYFPENSSSLNVAGDYTEGYRLYDYLKEHLHADATAHLEISSYGQFCRLFYTTDHHWNFRAHYLAYTDILAMVKGPEEAPLVPSGIAVFPVIFNGSFCRDLKQELSGEYFTVYTFDRLPEYTCYQMGKKRQYDHVETYLRGKFDTDPMTNHYANYYGPNSGYMVFENRHATGDMGTLLIIGDSFSTPIKTLLIGHYDRIIGVDLRLYEGVAKTPFSLSEVVREHDVDQILFLGSKAMYVGETFKTMLP